MDHYAVFGNPIAQSKSPLIHRMFAQSTGQRLDYTAILAPIDQFESTLEAFFSDPQARGCNVTVPFKERAAKWVDDLSDAARIAGAVNTIIRKPDGSMFGDNTDGEGLVHDLLAHQVCIRDEHILLIGAGGAARGVLQPLLKEQPASITIANRTASKAKQLADIDTTGRTTYCSLDDLAKSVGEKHFAVIINSTSASLNNELPGISDSILKRSDAAYDMVYGKDQTIFMRHCRQLGVTKVIDGLGMLVAQAASSFAMWRGVKPDTTEVLSVLREQL